MESASKKTPKSKIIGSYYESSKIIKLDTKGRNFKRPKNSLDRKVGVGGPERARHEQRSTHNFFFHFSEIFSLLGNNWAV